MDASRIRMLAMDVDGTLTDGRIHMGPEGELFKSFDVRDGYAIARMLPEAGVTPAVITARESAIVARRCEELGIAHVYQGVGDKLAALERLAMEEGITLANVAYVGDDLNDLPVLRAVRAAGGLAACPADAAPEVRDACGYVCTNTGGHGAVREVAELVLTEPGSQKTSDREGT